MNKKQNKAFDATSISVTFFLLFAIFAICQLINRTLQNVFSNPRIIPQGDTRVLVPYIHGLISSEVECMGLPATGQIVFCFKPLVNNFSFITYIVPLPQGLTTKHTEPTC